MNQSKERGGFSESVNIREMQPGEYPRFLELWKEAFGDERDAVDEFFAAFEGRNEEIVLIDGSGVLQSALTLFEMGDLRCAEIFNINENCRDINRFGRFEVVVSYAICTSGKARGRGYGSMITKYAAERVRKRGKISMLSPASRELVDFYEPVGYKPLFRVRRGEACAAAPDCEAEMKLNASSPVSGGIRIRKISAEDYGERREAFLSGIPHIRLSAQALEYVRICSESFFEISARGRSAIFASEGLKGGVLGISELLPEQAPKNMAGGAAAYEAVLGEYAAAAAGALGASSARYSAPAARAECGETSSSRDLDAEYPVQAMIYMPDTTCDAEIFYPYFGFPFD